MTICFAFFCCRSTVPEKDHVYDGLDWIVPETKNVMVAGFMDIYETSIFNNKPISENWRYFYTVLQNDTLLYGKDDGSANSFLETIQAGTKITILARNINRDNIYYLIKKDNDTNLWSGWIEISAIDALLNHEIDNVRYGEKYLKRLQGMLSVKNKILADHASWMGEYVVVENTGRIIAKIPDKEIMQIAPNATDGGVIGWSTDETKIWFQSNHDATIICYGIIDVNTGNYVILDSPPEIGSYIKIDYDTGKAYYTDYRYHPDADGGRLTRESGRIFHLWEYNFFTGQRTQVDTNIGDGFNMEFINGEFKYTKINYY